MLCAGLGTFVTYNPTTVALTTTLVDAMRLMDRHCFRHLPVIDEQHRLVGVISDVDVSRALLAQRAWEAQLPPGHIEQVCRIGDLAVHSAFTIDVEMSPREALLTLLAKGFHSLPVTQQEKLVGILTSTDYLRELSYGELPGYHLAVSDQMSAAAMSIPAAASIDEAGEAMQQGGREELVVVNGKQPLGIVTLRDVRRAVESASTPTSTSVAGTVRKLLTGETATIGLDNCLGTAAQQLIDERCKALAVVDDSNHLRGLLTQDDVLKAIAAAWNE